MRMIIITVKNFVIYLKDSKDLILEKLIRLTLYSGAFLLPLFCWPLTSDFLAYSKVILFYVLIILALVLLGIKMLITKKIVWQMQFLDIPVVLFLAVYFLASLFSIDRYQSFLGTGWEMSGSFVTILFLVIFYFLATRFLDTVKAIKIVLFCLLAAIICLFINAILNLGAVNLLPLLLGNSVNAFYFLFLLGLFISAVLAFLTEKRIFRIAAIFWGIIFLLSLFVLHNQQILLLITLVIFIFILISSFRSQYFSSKLVVFLTFILFVTVLILVLPIGNWVGLPNPVEFSLPLKFGWQITSASLSDNFLLGAGPQNFAASFYKYKPLAFNLATFWQLGFEKNSNFWLENLNNIGVLGAVIFLLLVVKYLFGLLASIRKFEASEGSSFARFFLAIICTTIFTVLLIFGWLSNFSFILLYLLILFLALGSCLLPKKNEEKIFINKPLISGLAYLLGILILCFGYFGWKIVAADIFSSQALAKDYQTQEDFSWGENKLQLAQKNNPSQLDYGISLSNLAVKKLLLAPKNTQLAELQPAARQVKDNLNLIMPKNNLRLDDYQALSAIYDNLKDFGVDVSQEQLFINKKLLALDPNNPELYIDRALLYFDQYTLLKNSQTQAADQKQAMADLLKSVKVDLDKSLELKNDYVLGYFNLGLYYQEVGDQEQTLTNIKKAHTLDPSQKIIVLSLKKLYLNQDKADKAIEILNNYLQLIPADNEVRLELAIVYHDNGQSDLAKAELNKILATEPDNQQAKELLDKIK